jgi:hypothetical protein
VIPARTTRVRRARRPARALALLLIVPLVTCGIAGRAAAALPARTTIESVQEFDKGELIDVSLDSSGAVRLAPAIRLAAPDGASGAVPGAPGGRGGASGAVPGASGRASDEVLIWSVLAGPGDELAAGTGNGGLILRRSGNGPLAIAARTGELVVTSLVRDASGTLLAGTLPNGRIFRLPRTGSIEPYVKVPAPYIWALALHPDGRLLVATGPEGVLYSIAADRRPVVLAKTTERNLTSLAVSADGTIYAGTEPSGLVLKIAAGGATQVLLDATQSEVRALALDRRGNLYAAATTAQRGPIAGGGQAPAASGGAAADALKKGKGPTAPGGSAGASGAGGSVGPGESGPVPGASPASGASTPAAAAAPAGASGASPDAPSPAAAGPTPGSAEKDKAAPAAAAASPEPAGPRPAADPSRDAGKAQSRSQAPTKFGRKGIDPNHAVYRIGRDGLVTPVFSASQAVLLSLAVDGSDRVLVGTGNQGFIFRIDGRTVVKLAKIEPALVLAMAPIPGGGIACGTGSPARIAIVGPGTASSGSWLSEPKDCGSLTRWGTLGAWGESPGASRLALYTRTGNTARPDESWGPWSGPLARGPGSPIGSPPARFLQVKAELAPGPDPATGPTLRSVFFVSQPVNLPPEIEKLAVGPPHVEPFSEIRDVEIREALKEQKKKKRESPALRHVKWEASDPNDDRLVYRLAVKGEPEMAWRDLSGRDLATTSFDWDTSDLPDGFYRIRLTASDGPSNTEDSVLTVTEESQPFLVDSTPPVVEIASLALRPGGQLDAEGTARDGPGTVLNVEYAIDDREYRAATLTSGMADSSRETFRVVAPGLVPGEHTLSIRVHDELGNVGSARRVFVVP